MISLPSAQRRRAQIDAQMRAAGLDYEFFDAVSPDAAEMHFDGQDAYRIRLNTGRELLPGEIACFASHMSLWRRCAERREPLVILEDDAALAEDFSAALARAASWIGPYGFIRLQAGGSRHRASKRRQVPTACAGGFVLSYCRRYPYGAMAYAIAPTAARRFLESSCILTGPVDLFIKQFWIHGQPLFAMSPPVVFCSELSEETTIEGSRDQAAPALLRGRRSLERWRDAILRGRFNYAYLRGRTDRAGTA